MSANTRASIAFALEAIELGDLATATALLTDALEVDGPIPQRRYECRSCSLAFPWPGERERHEIVVHGEAGP